MKDLEHTPPHGASSDVCFFFLDTICAITIHFYAHMVQRQVIRSRYAHGIRPYRLNPHDAMSNVSLFFGHHMCNFY